MLDSTLGKILTTKQNEPSIPADTPNPTTTKDDSCLQSNTSQAEVRFVFRVSVEEQIVFNGRIEKVKQIESEEISRVVSRIAWDGSKDDDNVAERDDAIDIGQLSSCQVSMDIGSETNEEKGFQSPVASLEGISPPPEDNVAIMSQDKPQDSSQMSQVESHTVKHVQTSPIATTTVTSATIAPPTTATTTTDNKRTDGENPVAQISGYQTDDFRSTPECDKNDTKPTTLNHISAASQQQQQQTKDSSQEIIDEKNGDTLKQNDDDSNRLHESKSNSPDQAYASIVEAIDAASAENQLIVDTLNDCVNSVDLESRQDNDNVGSEENCYTKKTIHLGKTYRKKDLNVKMVSAGKQESNPARRKNTGDNGPSTKRIRRVSSKDSRSSNEPSEFIENQSRHGCEQTDLAPGRTSNLMRQCKIFAKWSDNHFYPGTIIRPAKDRKYVVNFFDGAQRNVAETDLIPLSNIEGKQVRVSIAKNYCVNAIVHDQQRSPVSDQPMFDVEYQRDGLVRRCVPLKDIFLTAEQGTPLINQPVKPDKNPDESMFAGLDLDNIVHVKRSRRLQEMEDFELVGNSGLDTGATNTPATINSNNGNRRKRGQGGVSVDLQIS